MNIVNHFKGFVLAAIIAASFSEAKAANAVPVTYRAGEFTITLNMDGNNRTYSGCDARGRCINLDSGIAWDGNGNQGMTWVNGEYAYSVSWSDGSAKYLNIYKNNTRILRRQLVYIDSGYDD